MPSCLVCGSREEEVKGMYSFPSNPERSKVWQDGLGMIYTGESIKNYKLCSNHFTKDSFVDLIDYKLRRDAVPRPWGEVHEREEPVTNNSNGSVSVNYSHYYPEDVNHDDDDDDEDEVDKDFQESPKKKLAKRLHISTGSIKSKKLPVARKPGRKKSFNMLTKAKLDNIALQRQVFEEEMEGQSLRTQIVKDEMDHKKQLNQLEMQHRKDLYALETEHKRQLFRLEKNERLLKMSILKRELQNSRNS